MNKIYEDDYGVDLVIDMSEDISSATDISFYVRKPDGTFSSWTPTIYNSNFLKYTTSEGDLSQEGRYYLQPRLTIGDWVGSGNTVVFRVFSKVE